MYQIINASIEQCRILAVIVQNCSDPSFDSVEGELKHADAAVGEALDIYRREGTDEGDI